MNLRFRVKSIVPAVLMLCLLASCAARTHYYGELNTLVGQGDYLDAATLVEKSKQDIYGEKNALLYYLDNGMLLQLAGKYAESNESFERAKQLWLDYFTKSITTEASTFLISDNTRPYYGEDFERAMISVLEALNYVMLGQPNDALVEARQVDHFLQTLRVNYGYKNIYKEDAFARYLTGMLFENQGQVNDAYISYRQALDAYSDGLKTYGVPVPRALVGDALRTARELGFADAVQEITKTWGDAPEPEAAANSGELVVLDYAGFVAEKIEHFIDLSFGYAWDYVGSLSPRRDEQEQTEQAGAIARSILSSDQVRLAFPKYVRDPTRVASLRLQDDTVGPEVSSAVVDNVSAIAEQSLDDRIARIRARTIARAAIKFALAYNISRRVEKESGNPLLGWVTKKALAVGSAALEHADTRSWRSLPDEILMSRMRLSPGVHSITLRCYDRNGTVIHQETIRNVTIRPGKKTFVIVRTAL